MDDAHEAYDLADIAGAGLANTQAAEIWRQMMAIDTSWYRSAFSQQLRAEGRAEGIIEKLLRVLDKRGVGLTEEQRVRVESCTDLDLLDAWFDRALTAATAGEVFDAD
jgi:hypothetical protein